MEKFDMNAALNDVVAGLGNGKRSLLAIEGIFAAVAGDNNAVRIVRLIERIGKRRDVDAVRTVQKLVKHVFPTLVVKYDDKTNACKATFTRDAETGSANTGADMVAWGILCDLVNDGVTVRDSKAIAAAYRVKREKADPEVTLLAAMTKAHEGGVSADRIIELATQFEASLKTKAAA